MWHGELCMDRLILIRILKLRNRGSICGILADLRANIARPSLFRINNQYKRIMQHKMTVSIVLGLNLLEEGLNFLVPKGWWQGLLTLNRKKEKLKDLEIPDDHPLAFLFEIGLIQNSGNDIKSWMKGHEAKLKSLEEHAQRTGYQANELVNQAAFSDLDKEGKKRNRPLFQWWDFNSIFTSKGYNKILLSPFIDIATLNSFYDTFEWKVVSPCLYRLISQNDPWRRSEHYREFLIGIPVFLQISDIRYSRSQMDYTLGLQVPANIYFYNTLGAKYAMVGAIEPKLTQQQVLKYMFEGFNKMADFEAPLKCFRNQIRSVNGKIYCNFQEEEQICEKLQWDLFSRFHTNITSEGIEVIQLSSFSKIQVIEMREKELLQIRKPIKKIKSESVIVSPDKTVKKGFQSPSLRKSRAKLHRFNKFKQEHPKYFQMVGESKRSRTQEPHYSTEEETPSVIMQENPQIQQIIFQGRDDSRISFPMLKSYHSVQALVKLGEIKMNQSVPLPFTPSTKKVVKTRENKRVLISTSSNHLIINELGELVEREREIPCNGHIPEDVMSQLENLALQIRGQKKRMNIELLVKEELEAAKDKIDIESRTCKNEEEEMDDLDEVQSREC